MFRIYGFSVVVSLILLFFVGIEFGLTALTIALMLCALEITFSFDNAVINAKILERMSRGWQTVFLTVGILIAVFGVRLILPILLVSLATGTGFTHIVDLALNNPEEYSHQLEKAHPFIVGFGGIFLLMIFLDFMLHDHKIKWLYKIEEFFARLSRLQSLSIMAAIIILLGTSQLAHGEEQNQFMTAGLVGLLIYLVIHSLDKLFHSKSVEDMVKSGAVKQTFKAGLVGFIYLEIIDASFSLDGVIGAFAITKDIVLIAVGLGIGALFVRAITVHMLRRNVIGKYRYLDHGAHYAIGALALIMLTSIKYEVPEVVVGLTGITIITITLVHSWFANKKDVKGRISE
ncbi:DUF475 domain-containing protein [Candidatus Saccharibacteria bacterium]|nr:DUF475 domain-containing protein [Candidatus Saccharibacteria bacterium]